jgi:hypothetical protein
VTDFQLAEHPSEPISRSEIQLHVDDSNTLTFHPLFPRVF